MKRLIVTLSLVTALVSACGGSATTPPSAPGGTNTTAPAPAGVPAPKTLTPVTFQLDWIPFGRHAPYYVAKDKGWYKDAGLDVNIIQGTGIVQAFAAVETGRAQFAFNDIGYMPAAYDTSHVPLEALAVIYARAPQAIFYLDGQGIKQPKDLEGKEIAYSAGSSPYVLFSLFAKANGIDASRIKWQQTNPQSLNAVFLDHKVAGMVTYVLTQPALQAGAKNGDKVDAFMFGDYNVPILNNGLLVNRDWANQHEDIVRGFVQATMKGVEFALANPEEAIAIERKYQQNIDPKVGIAELDIIKKLANTPASQQHCLGWIDPQAMKTTVDDVQQAMNLKGPFNVDQMYTDKYLACAGK